MPLAAAVVGSAVVGAGASLAASSKASKAQTQAATQAQQTEMANLALQERLFNQQREDQQPWRQAGIGALAQLTEMTQPGYDFTALRNDPGYQFREQQGLRALTASLNGRGLSESGAAMKEAIRFGQDRGAEEFGNRFNRLSSLAGIGQTATNNTQQASQQFGGQAAQSYGAQAGNLRDLGNARASSYANTGAAISGLANSVGQYAMMRGMFAPQAVNPYSAVAGANLNLGSIAKLGTTPVFQPLNFGG